MESQEIGAAVERLKTNIAIAVSDAVAIFRMETGGITPSAIRVNMIDVSTMSDVRRQYAVGKALITFDL